MVVGGRHGGLPAGQGGRPGSHADGCVQSASKWDAAVGGRFACRRAPLLLLGEDRLARPAEECERMSSTEDFVRGWGVQLHHSAEAKAGEGGGGGETKFFFLALAPLLRVE